MRVIELVEPGGPEVLRIAERPSPALPDQHVRVQVAASGVNRADLSQRRGHYPPPPGYPTDILGMEYAGTVIETGKGCRTRKVGDPVMGITGGGAYAEELVVPEEETIRIPAGLAPIHAAAIPEAFLTAWDAIFRQGLAQPGATVLVHAAGSGVGTAAVQLARAFGSRSIGTSRSDWKLERATMLGLDQAILVREGEKGPVDWAKEVTAPVSVILDLVGGAYFEANLRVLSERGCWVVVGLTGGSKATIDLRALMAKRATLIGTVLRARSQAEKVELARAFEVGVLPYFERGALLPVIDRYFPAEAAAEAHRYLEENSNFGKVLLTWDAMRKLPPRSRDDR